MGFYQVLCLWMKELVNVLPGKQNLIKCWMTASCVTVIYFLKQWGVKIICSSNWWENIPGDRLLSCPHLSPLWMELVWDVFWLRHPLQEEHGCDLWSNMLKREVQGHLLSIIDPGNYEWGKGSREKRQTRRRREKSSMEPLASLPLQKSLDNDGCSPGERGL